MRLRNKATGVAISVSDSRGAQLLNAGWEQVNPPAPTPTESADSPPPPSMGDSNADQEQAPVRPPKRRGRPRKTSQ